MTPSIWFVDPNPLLDAMLARNGDLANYMLNRDVDVAVAAGKTPNGFPCTVIIAIGDSALWADIIGEAMVRMLNAKADVDRLDIRRN